jgi:hypothetical protein
MIVYRESVTRCEPSRLASFIQKLGWRSVACGTESEGGGGLVVSRDGPRVPHWYSSIARRSGWAYEEAEFPAVSMHVRYDKPAGCSMYIELRGASCILAIGPGLCFLLLLLYGRLWGHPEDHTVLEWIAACTIVGVFLGVPAVFVCRWFLRCRREMRDLKELWRKFTAESDVM